MKRIIVVCCTLIGTTLSLVQVWEEDYYNKEILLEHADLLQLTTYQQQQLVEDVLEDRKDQVRDDFFDFDSPTALVERTTANTTASTRLTFKQVSQRVLEKNKQRVSGSVEATSDTFLDFD